MIARCYDHSGNQMIGVELQVGDMVDYKQQGTRGSIKAVVVAFGSVKVQVEYRSWKGRELEPTRRWVMPRFLAVYRDGRRLP